MADGTQDSPGVRRRGGREKRGFWFRFAIAVIWPLAQILTRRERSGWEQLPAEGGVIVAANHVSIVDPMTVAQAVYDAGRLPHYLAKDTLFGMFFVGSLMRGAQQIPVRRATADAAQALDAAVAALRAGNCVVIYPEGTTSRDPQLWPMKARTGIARLALTTGVPVLPMAQWGPQEMHRRGGRLHPFRRPLVHAHLGAPIDLSAYAGREQTPAVLREVTDLIMGRITAKLAEVRGEQPPASPFEFRASASRATAPDDSAQRKSA